MLIEDPRYAETIAIVIAVAGGAGFVALLALRRVAAATLCLLVGAAALVAPQVLRARPFDVLVVTGAPGDDWGIERGGFHGGRYIRPDGTEIRVERPPGLPPGRAVILNDSDRLLTVRRFTYTVGGIGTVDVPLIAYLLPGEQRVLRGGIPMMRDDGQKPPDEIRGLGTSGTLTVLFRSREPYDAARHGLRDRLEAEMVR